jgi:hypothetical protein
MQELKADDDLSVRKWILPRLSLASDEPSRWHDGSQRPRQLFKSPRQNAEVVRSEKEKAAGKFVYSGNSTTVASSTDPTLSQLLIELSTPW